MKYNLDPSSNDRLQCYVYCFIIISQAESVIQVTNSTVNLRIRYENDIRIISRGRPDAHKTANASNTARELDGEVHNLRQNTYETGKS